MKTKALLSALLVFLLFLERSGATTADDPTLTHRSLISATERAGLKLSGLTIAIGPKRHAYHRMASTWRCLTAHSAIAHPRQIDDLTTTLLSSTAAYRGPASPSHLTAFGLDTPIRVEFVRANTQANDSTASATSAAADDASSATADPSADATSNADAEPLTFLLGTILASPTGPTIFVQRAGHDDVWELEAQHLAPLTHNPEPDFPPLLDRRLTAGCELDPARGITRAFIDHTNGASLQLAPSESNGERRWTLTDGTQETDILPYRFAGWLRYLQRAPYAGFTRPDLAPELGLDPPAARVTLFPAQAPPIELLLGHPVDGKTFLHNKTNGMLMLLPADAAALTAPTARDLTQASDTNPWEAWLR